MPGIGGVECLAELIKIDPTAKVVIASGFAVDELTQETIESAAKGFIHKPYNLNEALNTVRRVLDAG